MKSKAARIIKGRAAAVAAAAMALLLQSQMTVVFASGAETQSSAIEAAEAVTEMLTETAAEAAMTEADTEAKVEERVAEAVTEAEEETEMTSETLKRTDAPERTTAVYLGVDQYGAEETNRENMDSFRYRFLTGEEETLLAIDNQTKAGASDDEPWRIQNILKEGYTYEITVQDGAVIDAVEIPDRDEGESFVPVVCGVPGELTISNFLKTALAPVGTTLYIYGGGWNWEDDAASVQTKSIGVSQDWVKFFAQQDENFTFKDKDDDETKRDPKTSYYPFGGFNEYYYAGLDCSGYVGWVIYNTLQTESGEKGYVTFACDMASMMANMGYGTFLPGNNINNTGAKALTYEVKPGDIVSMGGHVWISLGTCEDGSVVLLHSTTSLSRTGQPGGGVQISAIGDDENCEAMKLADEYMAKYYPEWNERYGAVRRDYALYFDLKGEDTGIFSFTVDEDSPFSDPEGILQMRPDEVLELLFEEVSE